MKGADRMSKKQDGFGVINIVVIVGVILIIGMLGWLFWTNVINKDRGLNLRVGAPNEAPKETMKPTPPPEPTVTYPSVSE